MTITVSSGGGGGTFGTTTPGALVDTATANFKEVSKFTAPQAGNVVKVTGYVSGLGAGSGSQPVRAVIYANSGGNPGALLGVSNAVTVTAGQAWGWVDFTFPTAVSVSAGTVWMGYIAGTTSDLTQLRYDSVANDLRYNTNTGGYAAGPTNPFGSPFTVGLPLLHVRNVRVVPSAPGPPYRVRLLLDGTRASSLWIELSVLAAGATGLGIRAGFASSASVCP